MKVREQLIKVGGDGARAGSRWSGPTRWRIT